ncbi:Sister chromatid cohesion 1 protein 1 [Sesamum angolense]|uniref:Sister chromatid cohesion 1 protein 1 n=1 Tax=Sesamum angolense TaxID=2727404 RepID=A0AAE2BH23_9LAMI|nr:Sister chromatid cohesion 1 protein 1 [Sesamum angolense]
MYNAIGDEIRSIPSSGSGHGFFSHNSDINSGRSSKKRPLSASRNSGNGLEPVAEEPSWQHSDPNFKLARLSENGLSPDNDLLVETGPTQTQKHPVVNQPLDQITDSIRMHLKTHFDTPGSANAESLNQLAFGMNKKRAACLFYQTCGSTKGTIWRHTNLQRFKDVKRTRRVDADTSSYNNPLYVNIP